MATPFCRKCGSRQDAGDPFCAQCGAKQEPRMVRSNSLEEIVTVVEEIVEEPVKGPKARVSARRISSNQNIRRISIRAVPAEWENGGVDVVAAVEAMIALTGPGGWILTGYREDNVNIYLQAQGSGSVEDCVQHLRDDQQQYLLCRVGEDKKDSLKHLWRLVLITWRGKDIPPLNKGRLQEHKDIVMKMFDNCHSHLTCNGERRNITERLIRDRSGPLSGSHEL